MMINVLQSPWHCYKFAGLLTAWDTPPSPVIIRDHEWEGIGSVLVVHRPLCESELCVTLLNLVCVATRPLHHILPGLNTHDTLHCTFAFNP